MGLSETVIAALIGALGTVSASLFQLTRTRASADGKPRRSRIRSTLAIAALMLACAVAGYAVAELRAVGAREQIAALRAELTAQLQSFASATARLEHLQQRAAAPAVRGAPGATRASTESVAHLPPCRLAAAEEAAGPAACSESSVQRIALCAGVPNRARTRSVRLFSRPAEGQESWQEQTAGASGAPGLRFASGPFEHPSTEETRSICVNVGNWSLESRYAVRILVDWELPAPEATPFADPLPASVQAADLTIS